MTNGMIKAVRVLAIVLIAIGAIMVVIGLAMPEELGGSGMHSNDQVAYAFIKCRFGCNRWFSACRRSDAPLLEGGIPTFERG